MLNRTEPSGVSLPLRAGETGSSPLTFRMLRAAAGLATDQVGLILPTSLCSGQIARMAAERLNRRGLGRDKALSRFVALVHTEGCGVSSGASEALYVRTLLGYLTHPLTGRCLFLEHGCEKTHNDYMRGEIEKLGLDPAQYGWVSVQLDGGIERAMQKMEAWFVQAIAEAAAPQYETVGLEALRLGLLSAGPIAPAAAQSLAQLTRIIVSAGGTVVVPDNASLLTTTAYVAETLGDPAAGPSLAYARQPLTPGFHLMETPSRHWVETLAGLGATGVELILAYTAAHPMQSHPMIPVLQMTAAENVQARYGPDLDLLLNGEASARPDQILQRLIEVISHQYRPKLYAQGNVNFQITRGLLGISL